MELIATEDEKRIYSNAFKEIRLKKKYRSPFRQDPNPSFEFYINNKSKRLWWKDWGTGETGNCYDFLDKWTGELAQNSRKLTIVGTEEKPLPEILYKNVWDLKFWNEYGISKKTLEFFKVKQVETVNGYTHQKSFRYELIDGRYKIYSPGAKVRFWGTMKKTDVFGWEQLPEKGELLVITKSLKDVMTLYEMKISAISLASETITPNGKLIEELKKRFKNIVILYDNDKAGKEQSERIGNIFGLEKIFMQTAKDISDCVKTTNKETAEEEFWKEYLSNKKGKNKYDFIQKRSSNL